MFTTNDFFFFRKPAGLASTRGEEECFLTQFTQSGLEKTIGIDGFPHLADAFNEMRVILGYEPGDEALARNELLRDFSVQEEYGLVNRLDTDTSGLLYFARTRDVYEQYRTWQQAEQVEKYYLAQVWGDVGRNVEKIKEGKVEKLTGDDGKTETYTLSFPIMHHRHEGDRMVSCQTDAGLKKLQRQGRGKMLDALSYVTPVSYDPVSNTSIVRVMVHQGVRHQIRVHLATLGNPIIGDTLYGKGEAGLLQLVSCGMKILK